MHAGQRLCPAGASAQVTELERRLRPDRMPRLRAAQVNISLSCDPRPPSRCNTDRAAFLAAVEETKEHVRAGDVFQLVLSQRFERSTFATPFEVYRALRIVNPSPYMAYMQARTPL
jgi:anthranilate synthase component I